MDMLLKKRVEKTLRDCHEAARSFIDIVTESGVKQMAIEGIGIDPYNLSEIDPVEIALYGAKHIGIKESELEKFIDEYIHFMVLEKMIEV